MVVGEGGEELNPYVYPHILSCLVQWLRLHVTGDTGIPSIGFMADGAGFRVTLQRSMNTNRDVTDFGEVQEVALELNACPPLWIGEGAIPAAVVLRRVARRVCIVRGVFGFRRRVVADQGQARR